MNNKILCKKLQTIVEWQKLMQNTYWKMTNNVLKKTQEMLPEFTRNNPDATEFFAAWDALQQNPNEDTSRKFYNSIGSVVSAWESKSQK